jgi:hypothetical protein
VKRALPVLKPQPLSAERLFSEHFLPLYPPGSSLDAIRRTDANPAGNPRILEAIEETSALFAKLAPEALDAPSLALDFSDASIHRLSQAVTRVARDGLAARRSGPGEPSLLVHFVIHGSLYVGACIVKNHGGKWLVRSPLWETRVALTSKAGEAELSPFSWWLRALSDDGIEKHGIADRYRTLVEVPTEDVEAWPVVADPGRRLPRLAKVRYDLVYQHLKTHLPELRDFGESFPSPERFAELGFRWMDFALVGEGRALVMYGPAKVGFHAFWMTNEGFSKACYFECDRAPEPQVRRGRSSEGTETLEFLVSRGGQLATHEVLWWGP